MKQIQKFFLAVVMLILPTLLFAQYTEDVVRISNSFYSGSARFTGMSGAFGALGGDFTTLSVNPAGIGTYNTTEFLFTPALKNTKSLSNYFGTEGEERRTHVNFNNIGFIAPIYSNPLSSLKKMQLGIGFNRTQDFYQRSYIDGYNNNSSFLTGLATVANQYGIDVLNPIYPEDLAASTLLIFVDDNNSWANDNPSGNVQQSGYLETEGAINEMVISLGGNVNDKLYFGVTLGLPFYYYSRSFEYSETDVDNIPDTMNPFKAMSYYESLTTRGTGVNGKFGLIYKPIEWLRLGASIHTPTYYWNIKESWYYTMESAFDYPIVDPYSSDNSYVTGIHDETPTGNNNYEVTTGMRVIGSVAFVIGKSGLIDVDYEWVDQTNSRLSPASTYKDINTELRNNLVNQHIVRAGTEWKFNNFYIRGGYAWYSSPYKKEINDASINSWSLGCGLRFDNVGLDFGYQHLSSNSDYYLYNWGNSSSSAAMKNKANNYIVTLSFRY